MTASFLGPWSSFFVMTGSSAAALTGLMFVVISLVMGRERLRKAPGGISAFSTPTVVHFCGALLLSCVLVAPWRALVLPAVTIAIATLFGIVYVVRIGSLTRNFSAYTPDREDWICYFILPFVAYAVALVAAVALPFAPANALFALAASVIVLIFIGIRNAWDIVTYIATGRADEDLSNT